MKRDERLKLGEDQKEQAKAVSPEVHLRALGYIPKGQGGIWYNGTSEIKVRITWSNGKYQTLIG